MPTIAYFGEALPKNFNLQKFIASQKKPLPFGTLDIDNELTMHPQTADGFMGHEALKSPSLAGGKFIFAKSIKTKNKIIFICKDKIRTLQLQLICEIDEKTGIAIFHSQLKNNNKNKFIVDWLSAPALPIFSHFDEFINFNGRWCNEFEINRQQINYGQYIIENKRGRTSHESFPAIIALTKNTNENNGKCLAAHLGWSGNHKIILEKLKNGLCQLQMGIYTWPGEIQLAKNKTFASPKIYLSFSNNGLNNLSNKLHQFLRAKILTLNTKKPRPITFNSWEAIYFNHSEKKLYQLIDVAAELGVERFVLDDGWFCGRNDDSSALGDWQICTNKYPNGFGKIINYTQNKNMEFGLWIEPEMINKNSQLYKKHPNWIVNLKGTKAIEGRQQFVLDLTKKQVMNYLQNSIEKLLGKYNIAYLKWDMNRDHTMPFCQKTQKPISYELTCAFYQLIDKIKNNFPNVEIESCASGGGRIDYEILKRTQRFWASDSNDPFQRIKIHKSLSYFFPPEIIGAHIGDVNCHTSKRLINKNFAALTAMPHHFGIEMDITKLNKNEINELQQIIQFHKQNRRLWHNGQMIRIETFDENLFASGFISQNKQQAQIIALQRDAANTTIPAPLQIPNLAKNANYRIIIKNINNNITKQTLNSNRNFNHKLNNHGIILHSFAIENIGIQLPILYPSSGIILQLTQIK